MLEGDVKLSTEKKVVRLDCPSTSLRNFNRESNDFDEKEQSACKLPQKRFYRQRYILIAFIANISHMYFLVF